MKIAEVAGTVLKFDDDSVASDSDYVYAVTCVDDQERESKIFSGILTGKRGRLGPAS
ncbi:MAG: hypothetical protein MZV64_28855 [Ignavibacteriales bacterium]|nr:hypothetical protein [Ignavibacteriales bacterium]